MKRLLGLVLACLLLFGTSARATYALVSATCAASTVAGGPVTTTAIDTTGANLLVVANGSYAATTSSVVTDSKSNSWSSVTGASHSGAGTAQLWMSTPTMVGAGHTVTASCPGGSCYPSVCLLAFSGADASPLDQNNAADAGGNGFNATTAQAGSLTPTQTNELVVTGVNMPCLAAGCGSTTVANTISAPYIGALTANATGGQDFGVAIAYVIQTTATATNPTWSSPGSVNAFSAAVLASFKAAAAGASPFPALTVAP